MLSRLACSILLVELAELVSEFVSDTQTKNEAGKPKIQAIHLFLHLLENVGILDNDLRESVVLARNVWFSAPSCAFSVRYLL